MASAVKAGLFFVQTTAASPSLASQPADWLAGQAVKTAFIEKGSPQQNPFLERFSGTMRDELLNGEEFDSGSPRFCLPRPHVASAAKNWAAISRSRSPAATPRPRTR
jgi:hypothetical protein